MIPESYQRIQLDCYLFRISEIYNLFFIAPLIMVTFLLYFGMSTTESAGKWKDRNIRKLHLIAGIVMLALGLIVFLGLV